MTRAAEQGQKTKDKRQKKTKGKDGKRLVQGHDLFYRPKKIEPK